jgi:hypothetical protein
MTDSTTLVVITVYRELLEGAWIVPVSRISFSPRLS